MAQVRGLFVNPAFNNNSCALCTTTFEVAKLLALAAPEQGPAFFVFLCEQFKLSSSCNAMFGATTYGPVLTQVLANADVAGYDGSVSARSPPPRLTEELTFSSPLFMFVR